MRETPTISNTAYTSTTNTVADWAAAPVAIGRDAGGSPYYSIPVPQLQEQETVTTRIVKVFVSDPDESLPLADRVLYQGNEKLTDLTDQELFFELPIQDLMTKHNAVRLKTKDKEQSALYGRDVMLEEIKIRDLKMTIVNVAALG